MDQWDHLESVAHPGSAVTSDHVAYRERGEHREQPERQDLRVL